VVETPGGTAYWTRLPNAKVAGKTGTAQNPHGEDHSWYMAYAPDDPQIALAVIVENAGTEAKSPHRSYAISCASISSRTPAAGPTCRQGCTREAGGGGGHGKRGGQP
jgi:cell division protein FtsI/penicillin-binding protein 2